MRTDELEADLIGRLEDRRKASCDGKQSFDTYSLANSIKNRGDGRDGKRRRHREVYKCLNCHKYHLTEY